MISLLKATEIHEVHGGNSCSCIVNNTDTSKYMSANGDQGCIDGCGKIYVTKGETKEVSWGEMLNSWGKLGAGIATTILEVAGACAITGIMAAATLGGGSMLFEKIKNIKNK